MKRLAILGAVFAVLLGLWGLQRWQQGKVIESKPALTVSIDPDKVTKVHIKKTDSDVELVKAGGDWKLTKPVQAPADGGAVTSMLAAVKELKLEDVISTRKEKFATYQVDSTGTQVEIWQGDKQMLSAVVGKSSSDWTHTFVRRAGEDAVYRAEGVLSYNFNRRPDDWRDKAILKFEEPAIKRVVLEYPKEKLQVAVAHMDSTHWGYTAAGGKPEAADSLTAARLVSNAAKLSTATFATAAEAAGKDFANPDFRLRVETKAETHTVDFVTVDDQKIFAKRDGGDVVYSLYKGSLVNLMKKADDLRQKSPAELIKAAEAAKKKMAPPPGAKKPVTPPKKKA
jgi:hypothetical protein